MTQYNTPPSDIIMTLPDNTPAYSLTNFLELTTVLISQLAGERKDSRLEVARTHRTRLKHFLDILQRIYWPNIHVGRLISNSELFFSMNANFGIDIMKPPPLTLFVKYVLIKWYGVGYWTLLPSPLMFTPLHVKLMWIVRQI